jgi:hypothetical protein
MFSRKKLCTMRKSILLFSLLFLSLGVFSQITIYTGNKPQQQKVFSSETKNSQSNPIAFQCSDFVSESYDKFNKSYTYIGTMVLKNKSEKVELELSNGTSSNGLTITGFLKNNYDNRGVNENNERYIHFLFQDGTVFKCYSVEGYFSVYIWKEGFHQYSFDLLAFWNKLKSSKLSAIRFEGSSIYDFDLDDLEAQKLMQISSCMHL